ASVDGRSVPVPGPVALAVAVIGGVRFPASDGTYGLVSHPSWRSEGLTLRAADGFVIGHYTLDGQRGTFAKGTQLVPPSAFWHHLRPRDPAGSAALRACTDEQAGTLLSPAGELLSAAGGLPPAAGGPRAGLPALLAPS